ncbi:alpha/beta hydrolase [Flavobacterium sp. N3904]|uniref:alpha/beta hydrolase n=1 Tax=Flavobacterium sp. N3904 TaxID=2986835 RepID=UPI0022253043|nr:alpha/beta hydrolase [Flavobacterium sp. N3904]
MKTTLPLLLVLTTLFFISCSQNDSEPTTPPYVDDDLAGPISRPQSGYGSDGTYTVAKIAFPSPLYSGKNVEIFYPKGITSPRPTIFYSHPFGGEDSAYNIGLYEFIAKKGYVVVFAPYPTIGVTVDERYSTLWESFKKAVADYPNIIDTKKVGFMGHSFGGGASFALAHKGFIDEGWGQDGRFIFAMAQWYTHQITPENLQSFPANTKLITQVYDDDVTNDHRLAIDIFKNINIVNSEKDFILIKKSVLPTYTYTAEHTLPNTQTAYDAYDYYGVYRLLDALIDYSFNGSAAGKNVALGNGSADQITMPSYNGQALSPLEVTDNPTPAYPQSKYQFQCSSVNNPRIINCN